MPARISMELTPNPLSFIFTLEVLAQMSYGQTPRLSHNILFGDISSKCEVDIVEYPLLHLVESNEADFLEVHGFHKMVELIHKDFVNSSQVTGRLEVTVKS